MAISIALLINFIFKMPSWYTHNIIFFQCAYFGGLGGVLYCLRGVYINRCVLKRWDDNWQMWYYLRPLVSSICGAISYIFIRAGLLIFDATTQPYSIPYGFLAFAFIAGYNVDNFMRKIEDIALNKWGIAKSKVSGE